MGHETDLRARPPPPTSTDSRPSRRRPALLAALATIVLALLVVPTALAAAGPSAATASPRLTTDANATGPNETWAWGAFANVSASVQYVGAYNDTANLTGGNWTTSGAYIALNESVGLEYASFAIVNASSPNASTRSVQIEAAELRAERISVAASGTLPLAGNYSANASVPLAPSSFSLTASEEVLDVVSAFLNFSTGANGSLALENEHLGFLEGVNVSLDAVRFPNVTGNVSGAFSIRYVTGAIALSAWRAENLSATFSPALPLVEGPLSVGKTWTAASNATFVGGLAWAESVHERAAPGATASAAAGGSVAVNGSAPVDLACADTGTSVVRLPDGSVETDDDIACTNATGSPTYLAANGLIVLPSSDPSGSAGVAQTVPEHPASAPAAPANTVRTSTLYSPSHRFVDSVRASPQSGDSVTASPMTPASASAAMHGLGTPVRPGPIAGPFPAGVVLVVMGMAGAGAIALVLVLEGRQRRRL
jgi:hypothetical protein